METFIPKTCAVALLAAAASIAASAAQTNGSPAGNITDQNAQAAENAARTLNNTPPANGASDANATGQSAGASARTRHVMGVGSSGGNNAPAATNDAQSQATRELNQQPSTPSSVNGPAGSNMK